MKIKEEFKENKKGVWGGKFKWTLEKNFKIWEISDDITIKMW